MLSSCHHSLQVTFILLQMLQTSSRRHRQEWIISCKQVCLLDIWYKTTTLWPQVNRQRILDHRHNRIQFLRIVIKGLLQLVLLIRREETHNKRMFHWPLRPRKSWLTVVEQERALIIAEIVNWTINRTTTCLEIKNLKNKALIALSNPLLHHQWSKVITPRDRCSSSK